MWKATPEVVCFQIVGSEGWFLLQGPILVLLEKGNISWAVFV